MNEREAYIALNMMNKIGPVAVRSLRSALGSAAAIFEADRRTLMSAEGIGPESAEAIVSQRDTIPWQAEMERAEAEGIRLITPIDEGYPELLLTIHDPPLALYARGTLELRDRHGIAVVGTRRATHYGVAVTKRFASGLARAGLTVISGLALGIDTVAHEACLDAGGRTIAVLGSALDRLYPKSAGGLADRIAGQGAVLSEFPFGREPDKTTFPMRNRVVSGMSSGVLVVEADSASGALITANQANEHGRNVFAIPGRIDSALSRGTNDLIKNGAKLVTDVEEVLDEMGGLFPASILPCREGRVPPRASLSPDEQALVDVLSKGETDVDSLVRVSGLRASSVNAMLIGLEMKRVVRMLPGRSVELVS